MGNLTTCRRYTLSIAVCLLPLFHSSVAAQSFLDPGVLPEIPERPYGPGIPNHTFNTEIVENPRFADSTTHPSPYLLQTSLPLPHPTHSNILAEIYFDWNRERLKAEAGQIVEHLAGLLQKDPETRVDLQAICDERGTEAYSLTLGWQRLSKITGHLSHLGIPATQMTQVSYGSQPLCITGNTNCPQEYQRHREAFRLLSMAASRSGCLVRLRFQENQTTPAATDPSIGKPFLQRIHLAEIR